MLNMHFEIDGENELTVVMETARLQLRSFTEEDITPSFTQLFNDSVVMEKFGTGKRVEECEAKRVSLFFIDKWKKNDPFSALAVTNKETEKFVGQIFVEDYKPGIAELAYLFERDSWGKGIASEAVVPVATEYVRELVKREYQTGGKPLTTLYATARRDNPFSAKVLEKSGMEWKKEKEKFGAPRGCYRKTLG